MRCDGVGRPLDEVSSDMLDAEGNVNWPVVSPYSFGWSAVGDLGSAQHVGFETCTVEAPKAAELITNDGTPILRNSWSDKDRRAEPDEGQFLLETALQQSPPLLPGVRGRRVP